METLVVLIPLLLLAGSAISGILALAKTRGHEVPDRAISWIACTGPVLAFLFTVLIFNNMGEGQVLVAGYDWILAGGAWIKAGFAVDHLTMVMLMVVTGVGSLIHVYSTGYMKGDGGYARYFCYLNLFMFFMLVLVMANSLLLLFVGWEGVGLCSYLLIGFWWADEAKARAGMKAFLVNRIGDAGFLLGMLAIYKTAGTLNFQDLRTFVAGNPEAFLQGSGFFGVSLATASCLLLFLGATGKSAQIPLYVWLPDAMAGPTPVSALIHAATMVTAGVYMIGRMNFLYALSPTSMIVVSLVGALTAFFAGTIAMTQFDIKKVLAYSTVSQLGYMFIAAGLGAVSVAVFHLVAHAFFKACLFLGSGSVIHAMDGEQDMRKMGGLQRKMPITFITMAVSALAMAGIPPLAGFFSKDEILWKAFSSELGHGWFLWLLGIAAAFCTAVYMGRLIFMTFFGSCRADEKTRAHIHESPKSMTGVLAVLGVGAAVIGFLNVPHFLGGHAAFSHYVDSALMAAGEEPLAAETGSVAVELSLALLSVMVAFAGLMLAWRWWVKDPSLPATYVDRYPEVYELVHDKYRVDEFYQGAIVEPLENVADGTLYKAIDRKGVDGAVNGMARAFRWLGARLASAETGNVRTYVAVMIAGILLVMLSLLT
ncbi:MAG TPA: NADH-quinone oxidoreductase subunit L [Planctomycetes bacterium]|nr:NADH-quinone oxidoreductase subunit L [Planctomycetota bacterium]